MNVLDGLDWRRAFGFFLWYGTSNGESIPAAMELYEKCFGEGLCAFPLTAEQRAAIGDSPGFFPKADTSDILFLILKLYKDRFYSLISTVI